jgi:photosystem II stability/assembly factor-like uncharacterized protein
LYEYQGLNRVVSAKFNGGYMLKKYVVWTGLAAVVIAGVWLMATPSEKNQETKQSESNIELRDAHGLAVDRKDSSKVYVATHTGLLSMDTNNKLQRVSESQDDYMGFSAHPSDPLVFYTSGHSASSGNLGFQKSTDGGKTWKKIADGVNGPVDFHTMTVSQVNPNVAYGVDHGKMQRSKDEGKNWEVVNTNMGNIITLATNRSSENNVFAGTTSGLYVSNDNGSSWDKLSLTDAVTALTINPANDLELYAYANGQGLLTSIDGGKTWKQLAGYKGEMVTHLAIDPKVPTTVYLINQTLEVHKSTDNGQTWSKVR